MSNRPWDFSNERDGYTVKVRDLGCILYNNLHPNDRELYDRGLWDYLYQEEHINTPGCVRMRLGDYVSSGYKRLGSIGWCILSR